MSSIISIEDYSAWMRTRLPELNKAIDERAEGGTPHALAEESILACHVIARD